jgi:hypothetical protein
LRELYLVQKPSPGPEYSKYLAQVARTPDSTLKDRIKERTLAFAAIWFAKKAYEHRGWLESEGWTGAGIIENGMEEFKAMHRLNEEIADAEDRLDWLVDYMLIQARGPSVGKPRPIKD